MNIAIVGTGAIGSVFAYQLARAGHDVTVIARGSRLAQLQREGGVVHVSGERAAVHIHPALDVTVPYDLVLVTVLAPHVAAVLPDLQASVAKSVMFMFNTFEPLEPLRAAVGAGRFTFGFPAGVLCVLRDGHINPQIRGGTTTDSAPWAAVFTQAGIPTVVEPDMHSWLRSHAALVIPLMAMGVVTAERQAGVSWREAGIYARAMRDAFDVVRDLGHGILPSLFGPLSRMTRLLQALLWTVSRTKMSRELGALGPQEARMLVDMMTAAAPGKTTTLLAIRP
jgi:2-dehydropantoate 2-reductase